jgi:hypothetical protein
MYEGEYCIYTMSPSAIITQKYCGKIGLKSIYQYVIMIAIKVNIMFMGFDALHLLMFYNMKGG